MAGTRMQITVAAETMERMEALCKQKGIKKSALVAIAIETLLRKEQQAEAESK